MMDHLKGFLSPTLHSMRAKTNPETTLTIRSELTVILMEATMRWKHFLNNFSGRNNKMQAKRVRFRTRPRPGPGLRLGLGLGLG